MEQNVICNFYNLNYWKLIGDIAQNCKLDPKEAVIKFHSLTGFPTMECINIILSEKVLFMYNTDVEINNFVVERFNGKSYKIAGIQISDNKISYLIKGYENYLFGVENLKQLFEF